MTWTSPEIKSKTYQDCRLKKGSLRAERASSGFDSVNGGAVNAGVVESIPEG